LEKEETKLKKSLEIFQLKKEKLNEIKNNKNELKRNFESFDPQWEMEKKLASVIKLKNRLSNYHRELVSMSTPDWDNNSANVNDDKIDEIIKEIGDYSDSYFKEHEIKNNQNSSFLNDSYLERNINRIYGTNRFVQWNSFNNLN